MSEFLNELEVLGDVSRRLETAGIPFMLTGSLAMNFYAAPRMTRDIDLVLEISPSLAGAITRLFEPDYYVSQEGIADAIRHGTLFNLIHQASVIKVDCIIRKPSAYGRVAFERRQRLCEGNLDTWIATKEDLILSKLSWFAETESERQLNDIRNLLATGYDAEYVAGWVRDLGLSRFWENATAG